MEEQYWEHFAKTGAVTDYLSYKMEVYGHCRAETKGVSERDRGNNFESDCIDRNGAFNDTNRRI